MTATITESTNTNATTTSTATTMTFSQRWTRAINRNLHEPLLKHFLHPVTQHSARNPCRTMVIVTVLSLALIVLGLFTNFHVEVDGDLLWTPYNTRPQEHNEWIESAASGFNPPARDAAFRIHRQGDNVLAVQDDVVVDTMNRLFQVLDTIRNVPSYDEICSQSLYRNPITGQNTCEFIGPVRFYNYDTALWQATAANSTATDILQTLSSLTFPDGTPVAVESMYGKPVRDTTTGLLTSAQMMTIIARFPDLKDIEDFELEVIEAIQDLADAWDAEDTSTTTISRAHLEFITERSFDDEFARAIVNDIPLVPAVFIVMSIFTAAIFGRRRAPSRSLLGLNAVVAVFLSILSGYGLLFLCNIPLTSMTQILPFVIFGIGLDDTFVVMGCYQSAGGGDTKETMDVYERIYHSMEEAGPSITVTTITSALAFGLGCLSSVPAVRWLCLFAFPTIIFVYIYTLTYFIAALAKDELRIQQGRRDCCPCLSIQARADETPIDVTVENKEVDASFDSHKNDVEDSSWSDHPKKNVLTSEPASPNCLDHFMDSYAEFLLRPHIKAVVLALFAALLALCAWSTSLMIQEFTLIDIMPDDSYVADLIVSTEKYTNRGFIAPYAYFRYVDQSDPNVQQQMEDYINDLVGMDSISQQPDFFWLRSFKEFVSQDATIAGKPFTEQLDEFLAVEENHDLFSRDIVREADGSIRASRVHLYMDNVSENGSIESQMKALEDQQQVTSAQPANQGRDDWAFFIYHEIFNIWEFYVASVSELILTTILGVASITGISLIFIPHWTAALFILPMISVLYIDLIGVMQWGGVRINAVSYVTLVMSIGLLVDFLLHVLLRYYEEPGNRREKTVAMLKSMGVSILTGGISTLLGTVPLAFSTSEIFSNIFIAFLGLVTLGLGHGLILLPVILATIGPEEQIVRATTNSFHGQDMKSKEEELEEQREEYAPAEDASEQGV